MGQSQVPRDELLEQLAESTGYCISAIQFVANALNAALEDRSLLIDDTHTNALGVCRCVLELSVDWFSNHAEATLREWSVVRSEDVGRIVYGLVNAGVTHTSEQDRIEDFDHLFDLDQDQSTWVLKW